LGQDAFGEFEKCLMAVVGGQVTLIIGVFATLTTEFIQGRTALELLQIIEDRLLDQPVGCAVNGLRSRLQSLAGGVVKFDAEGGGGHFSYPHDSHGHVAQLRQD
jgi:hypothetical protein